MHLELCVNLIGLDWEVICALIVYLEVTLEHPR